MKPSFPSRGGLVVGIPAWVALSSSPLSAATLTWNNSSADGLWSTPANWDSGNRPDASDAVIFPAGLGGTVSLTIVPDGLGGFYTPSAQSIQCSDDFTLSGSTFIVSEVGVDAGSLVQVNAPISPSASGILVKSGAGTLVVGTPMGATNGVTINGGVYRANVVGSLGGSGDETNINSGGTLEINGFAHLFPIRLNEGGSLIGLGNSSTYFVTDSLVISGSASAVSIGAAGPTDVLRTDWLSGGSSSTVITKTGDGTLRLNSENGLQGSWVIPSGTVQIVGTLENLGTNPAASVTLSGGTLAVELSASSADYTDGPGNNILVTADSGFLNDRPGLGTGRSATFGTLTMGSQTLSVAAGANVTSGDAGFTFENLTLTGDPVLSITQGNTGPGHFQALTLNGGGVPRAITKTGPGNISFHASGTNELATGSTITATGGGTMLLNFPAISLGAVSEVPMAQNPIGNADLSITDGTLSLRGSSTGTIFSLPNDLTLGGDITVDPARNVTGSGNVVFRMSSITLKPGTVMSVSGDNSFAIGSLGPVVLEGNATVQGFNSGTTADGVTNFYGGISGGPGSALTIGNTVRPINLTIDASSTYGGGTLMQGGNVTLNAASAFGTGATTLSGGTLVLNADDALSGTVTLNGGTLVVNGPNVLASNPVVLNGGTLDLRTNSTAGAAIPSFTVSGTATLNTARVSSSGTAVLTVPVIDVSGNTTLTITAASNLTSLLSGFDLAGDLTLNSSFDTRVLSISEDAAPRKLIKTGNARLDLEGASSHSGGTEVRSGILYVQDGAGLGSGTLTIGDTAGTAAAIARFAEGFTIPNNIVVRSGSTGLMTIDAETGVVTWNGSVDLQKSVTLDNGSATAADFSTFNGIISGAGDITKIGGGEIILANASNSFGSGSATSVSVSAGNLTVASDGALGNTANGVNLTGTGILKITGSFTTGRTLTVTGTGTDVNVTSGNTLTLSAPIAGTGTFAKGDAGTLEFAPSVDGGARGSSINQLKAGTLRLQGALNLGNASPLTLSGGTLQLLNDSNTNFGHPLTLAASSATVHVDRAAGGSATNGRHTLGTLSATTGTLTVTGDHGFGLTLGDYTTTGNSYLVNNAPGALVLSSITGNPGTNSRTLTIRGSGDIEVSGAISEGAGTGSYGLVKEGPGRFTFGSSVTEFNRTLTVEDGTVDLNGLPHSLTGLLTMGGAASALGARIETDGGSLTLGAGLTFSNSTNPTGARITGNLGLAPAVHPFIINNSSAADADVLIDGPITGSPGSSLVKSGSGTLRFSGAGNSLPGVVSISNGVLELAKSSGDAIGTGGLDLNPTTSNSTVKLLAAEQIHNGAAVNLSGASEVILDLGSFTETVGPLTLAQTDVLDYTAVRTGATGTLVLNGNLTFNNNINSSSNEPRNVLITGSGTETVPAFDGTLDLGGATRTIHVATTTVGANEPLANATIETQIINGGILKTGPRTLYLTNPNNTFAGGLQIAQGFIRPGAGTSLGLGPVTFTNPPGTLAGFDFGASSTTVSNTIVTGTGDFVFIYAAPAPNVLTLSSGFELEQDLTVDVVNGSVQNSFPTDTLRAVVDVTGVIDDGTGTFGLTKVGNGMLKLAAGNTYGGPTVVERGILSVAADSSLGDGTEALTLDGGCLAAAASFTLNRDLVVGANGGSLRADTSRTMTIAGNLDWGSATTGTDGGGRIVLSGPTSGSGNLVIGESIAFASGSVGQQLTWNAEVCLQGSAALPSGNLDFGGFGVLELGNGDFTRPLGTGPGEVQMSTNAGGGWAAVGADRVVNLGGAGDPLVWGQVSPPFLYQDGPSTSDYGQLVLGSFAATHTVEFQNDLVFPTGPSFSIIRQVTTWDGAAAVDGRISGDAIQSDPSRRGDFTFSGNGTLEVSGDLLGDFAISQDGEGTTILSGNNTGLTQDITVFQGKLVLANDASLGSPYEISIFPGAFPAELDASALSGPLTLSQYGAIWVYGLITGDVLLNGSLYGSGTITGDVTVPADSYFYPDFDSTFTINGNLDVQSGGYASFDVQSPASESASSAIQVNGSVNLSGSVYASVDDQMQLGETQVLILNDGSDPINGTFSGLPEGWGFGLGNGLALQVTYLANGDGGPVGNDFAVTLVVDTFSADLALSADAPLAVPLGAGFSIQYTIDNLGPNDSPGSSLEIELPPAAAFLGSTPAGTLVDNLLIIPIGAIPNGGSLGVTLDFTAPGFPTGLFAAPWIYNTSGDDDFANDYAPTMTAVMPGGCPTLTLFGADPVNDEVTLGIDAIQDVRYAFQYSTDLEEWFDLFEFLGEGQPVQFTEPMDEADKEFFRFSILPYNGGGGGEETLE
jgi:autotransporter-associated beta strand protein